MPADTQRCPKCRGEMEVGALVTRHSWLNFHRTEWMEGLPEWAFFTGLKIGGRARHPVRTDRCRECGYLESYAKKV
jgi:hypothetical protein